MLPNAPELHAHLGYSVYDGLGSPYSLVERGFELGWDAVSATEHGNMASTPALYAAVIAKKWWRGNSLGLPEGSPKPTMKLVPGVELYVAPEEDLVDKDKDVLQETRHLTVHALNFEGYENLVRWSNESFTRPNYYSKPRLSLERMAEIAPRGLHHNVVSSGCLGGECCQCILHVGADAARLYLDSARQLFPNFYVEVQDHSIDKFLGVGLTAYEEMCQAQDVVNAELIRLAKELGIKLILTNDSHFQRQAQRKPHMAMMARKSFRKEKESHERETHSSTTAEFQAEYIYYGSYLRSLERVSERFDPSIRREMLQSVREVVDASEFELEPIKKFSYTLPISKSTSPIEDVRDRSTRRLKMMIARHGDVARVRFEYELGAMADFAHYLLIYADIVKMARDQGVYTWTRGSACASLVCFCLGVHQIDPIHYGLLFERFVNPARAKFPDVDLDIESNRQPDVAKMVGEYMDSIGQHMLPICTHQTVSNRNAFRMMAEASGIEKEQIDELAKLLPQMIDSGMVNSDEEAYELIREEYGIDLHGDASAIFDTIGGFSQHACAFVIGTKERPLSAWVPEYRIGSSDAVVTQYNMKQIEALGFLKLDLLKLDTLSILHSVARQLGEDMDWIDRLGMTELGIYDSPEPEAMALLREGRTDGVFTFQGATQRRGCVEVAPETTQDLVAIQAIYRPGATRSGADKQFVNRRHGREQWTHLNSFTEKRWGDTYGIPIYQEQIMELGFDLGMSGAEVDDLYKAIKMAKGIGRGAAEMFAAFEPVFRKYSDKLMPQEDADAIWARTDAMQGYCVYGGGRVQVVEPTPEGVDPGFWTIHDLFQKCGGTSRQTTGPISVRIAAFDQDEELVKQDECVEIIRTGYKDCVRLTFVGGLKVTATPDHHLLTEDGWKAIEDIAIGEYVASDSEWRYSLDNCRPVQRQRSGELVELLKVESAGSRTTYDLVMASEEHNFICNGIVAHNSFNKAHATSFAVLGKKSAVSMARWTRETLIGILERYPDNPRYIAAAISAGFHFELPDVNLSNASFTKGDDPTAIRIGLHRIAGIGKAGANAIVRNQPFSSIEDMRERVGGRYIKQGEKQNTVQDLSDLGALASLGYEGTGDDLTQLRLLSMVLNRPKAFEGIQPTVSAREGSRWRFLGLQDDLMMSWGKAFCAKLFWIPPGAKLVTKTSATGTYNAHLLDAVDVNGIPFELQVGEKKAAESNLIHLMAEMEDCVFCLDGQMALPFLRGGLTNFKVWGCTDAEYGNPLVWGADEDQANEIIRFAYQKKEASKAA